MKKANGRKHNALRKQLLPSSRLYLVFYPLQPLETDLILKLPPNGNEKKKNPVFDSCLPGRFILKNNNNKKITKKNLNLKLSQSRIENKTSTPCECLGRSNRAVLLEVH